MGRGCLVRARATPPLETVSHSGLVRGLASDVRASSVRLPARAGLWALSLIVLWRAGLLSGLNALAALYFSNFLWNAAATLRVPGRRGRLFALGMWLFLCCDVCVGLRNLHILPPAGAAWVQMGMWFFYLPGQVLISLSALPDAVLRGVQGERK